MLSIISGGHLKISKKQVQKKVLQNRKKLKNHGKNFVYDSRGLTKFEWAIYSNFVFCSLFPGFKIMDNLGNYGVCQASLNN